MAIQSKQIEISSTPVSIHKVDSGRPNAHLTIHHLGTSNTHLYLGSSDVSTSNGYVVEKGDTLKLDLFDGEELFGVFETGPETISVIVTGE